MARLDRIPQSDDKGRLRAVLETPQGCRNKLKYEPEIRTFSVTASLPAGTEFPFDFGFIPRTRAADGDPLDVLVLMDAPAHPGAVVPIRVLGVIEAEQSDGGGRPYRNDRLVAVADGSTERGRLRRLTDLDEQLLTQVEGFFELYDRLTGKTFKPIRRRGRPTAMKLLRKATAGPERPRGRQRR